MESYILKSKNQITIMRGILIAVAFISKWTLGNMEFFKLTLLVASVLGLDLLLSKLIKP